MKSLKKRNRFKFIINMVVFRATLDFLYVFVLGEYYVESYLLSTGLGVFNIDVNIYKYLLSWVIYIVFLRYLNRKIMITENKASEILILGLFCMSFTPSISLFGLANLHYEYLFYFLIFWGGLLVSNAIINKEHKKKLVLTKRVSINDNLKYNLWIFIVVVFSIGVIFISWRVNRLIPNLTLNSESIYLMRSKIKELRLGTFVEYFRNNAMFIVIPFAAIFYYRKKNVFMFIVLVIVQILLFGIDNQKAALFILPASIGAYQFYKKKMVSVVPTGLIILNFIIYFEHLIDKTDFFISNILERIYYLPAILSNCYFEFFTGRPPVIPFVSFFSKIGLVSNYEYSEGVPYMIAAKYFYNPAISANTGMFGSAYSYGLVGVIIIPITYAILFHLLDRVSEKLEIRVIISLLIVQVFVITGATIFVVVSVYGFITMLVLLSLVNGNKKFN